MNSMSLRLLVGTVLLGLSISPIENCTFANEATVARKFRDFEFEYAFAVQDLPAGAPTRIWFPTPVSDNDQTVKLIDQSLPGKARFTADPVYNNRMVHLELASTNGQAVAVSMRFSVRRFEVRGLDRQNSEPAQLAGDLKRRYLAANSNVPISGKPLDLLDKRTLPEEPIKRARFLYDQVDAHVTYDKSRPGYGRGDSLWVCDSRFGNCTDFHSLFISMARGNQIPARFEIGFPLPTGRKKGEIGGYHCWARFFSAKHGWVPVDISEADKAPDQRDYYFGNLTPDRIVFTKGRDIQLEPPQSAPPLNYFIYPHVEVDGKVWPNHKIKLDFSFSNISGNL